MAAPYPWRNGGRKRRGWASGPRLGATRWRCDCNDYPGAHSIVDIREVVSGVELDDLLPQQSLAFIAEELVAPLGTATPDIEDWDRIGGFKAEELWKYEAGRDSGRHLVL
jgi:hypothetical protein